MSTKNNPGEWDCYSKAEPDEPMFVLLARDESAHLLVLAWAHARMGNSQQAIHCVMTASQIGKHKPAPDIRKINEAMDCVHRMVDWLSARQGEIIPNLKPSDPLAEDPESH
jgi:hypothetical protein